MAVAALTAALSSAAAQLFLRNFYLVLSFDAEFSAIFAQIASPEAKMSAPFVLCFLLSVLLCAALYLLWHKGVWGKILTVMLGFVSFLLLCTGAILLTRVNGVMFLDVVLSLVPLLTSGVL